MTQYHTTTVTVKYNNEEYDVKVRIPYEVSTRLESRGEHFGTPCSETVSEVTWDIEGWEYVDTGDCPKHLLDDSSFDQRVHDAVEKGIEDGSITPV